MMNPFKIVKPKLSRARAAAGRKGAIATLERHGREKLSEWGKTGGRPRLKTLVELQAEAQTNSQQKINKRRRRLPGVIEELQLMRAANEPAGSAEI